MRRTVLFSLGIAVLFAFTTFVAGQPETVKTLLRINNSERVHDDAKVKAGTFKLEVSARVTFIETYHWNDRKGKAPGTIGLRHTDGTTYTWQAMGKAGMNNVPNAHWFAEPNVVIKPGRYTVVDSDPPTWSHNEESGGYGFVTVKAVLLKKK